LTAFMRTFVSLVFHHPATKGRAVRERRNVKIHGSVQGVFFRETVRRIASRYDVSGFVHNVGGSVVEIEAEGEREIIAAFIHDVLAHPPSMARIDDVASVTVAAEGVRGFSIARSIH
jgi:hydrogenase maturation factor HypF (carbamoyltransferase family)